jgi:hypothetical protein
MILLVTTLLLAPLAANPSMLDGTWHLVAVEEEGQACAPGTATLTARRTLGGPGRQGRARWPDRAGLHPGPARPGALRTACPCSRRPTAWKTGP